MNTETVIVEHRGDIGVITLSDPATLNALSRDAVDDLAEAFRLLAVDKRSIVLTGAGNAFCSGAALGSAGDGPPQRDAGLVLETHVNPFLLELKDLKIPWITAVNGGAAGVGCALALSADLIVVGERAYFLQAFARIGLVPDGGSSHLLMRSIGRARAMEMMLLGDKISAATALQWGLVNRVVPADRLMSEAFELAERLAKGPRSLGLIRELGWQAVDGDYEAALLDERRLQKAAGETDDFLEGVAAFRAKRPARFAGT